jgi:hypothetical protein
MKKLLVSITALLCFFSVASAQQTVNTETSQPAKPRTVFGFKAGLNASIFSASVNSESSFKSGFHFGIYVRTPITHRFFFRPELYYSSQGQKDNYQYPSSGASAGKTTTTLQYINIPLLFEQGRKVSFQFGPQIGILAGSREKGTIENQSVNDNLKDVMKAADLSLVLGVGFSPGDHFNFGFRYNCGLTDIYKGDDVAGVSDFPSIKNRVLHFYIACSL